MCEANYKYGVNIDISFKVDSVNEADGFVRSLRALRRQFPSYGRKYELLIDLYVRIETLRKS